MTALNTPANIRFSKKRVRDASATNELIYDIPVASGGRGGFNLPQATRTHTHTHTQVFKKNFEKIYYKCIPLCSFSNILSFYYKFFKYFKYRFKAPDSLKLLISPLSEKNDATVQVTDIREHYPL